MLRRVLCRVLCSAAVTAAALTATTVYFAGGPARAPQSPVKAGLAYVAPDPTSGTNSAQRQRSGAVQVPLPKPATPAASARPGPKVGSKVVFVGDYETGNFAQWGTCQSVILNAACSLVDGKDRSMEIVPGRQGKYAAKFVVGDGDVPDFGGGERSEVSSGDDGAATHEGDERWYQWSMRIGDGFPSVSGWMIFMQWHSGSGSPPLAVEAIDGNIVLTADGAGGGSQTVGPMRPGQWVDYVLHVRFSNSADVGFVEAWENGVQTVPKTFRATMSSDSNYLKQGIYRSAEMSGTSEVTIDGLVVTAP